MAVAPVVALGLDDLPPYTKGGIPFLPMEKVRDGRGAPTRPAITCGLRSHGTELTNVCVRKPRDLVAPGGLGVGARAI